MNDQEKILTYYDEGQIYQEFYIVNGKLNGKKVWYYKSGKVKQIGNYKNGICEGKFTSYYQNGKIKSEVSYQNGNLLGLKNFEIKGLKKLDNFNKKEKIKNQEKNKEVSIEKNTNKDKNNKTPRFLLIIVLLLILILCNLHFGFIDKFINIKNKETSSKVILNEPLKKEENKKIIKQELLKENKKSQQSKDEELKKANIKILVKNLRSPIYSNYILNVGEGYKVPLPDNVFNKITQNKKDKILKFSSKYDEINITFRITSVKSKKLKENYQKEIKKLDNEKIVVLKTDLSKNKYFISCKKAGNKIYKYAYFDKKNSEVISIDFYYPSSFEKEMEGVIEHVINGIKKK